MTDALDFSSELWQLMIRTFHIMRRVRQKELNKFHITTRSSAVLRLIIRLGEGATLTKIAEQLVMEDHSMSEQLTRMEKAGLIKKVRSSKNKNQIRVEMTEKGYEAYNNTLLRNSVQNIMSVITPEEQRTLWSIVAKIREQSLKVLGKENPNLYPPSDPDELAIH